MSVWKKAAKSHQKTHRERHQPEERKHLGLLEKKKDYVKRARDYHEKQETLKILHKRALNKNPDEFYHHMINSKVEDGKHFEKETRDEDTPEQVKLMQTQDLKYIVTKRTQEKKKIDKLQAQLHLSSVAHAVQNNHVYFKENIDKEEYKKNKLKTIAKAQLPDVDLDGLAAAAQTKKQMYTELAKRINRERELTVIQQKIEIKNHLQTKSGMKPKRVRKGNKDTAPVYLWKYERKK